MSDDHCESTKRLLQSNVENGANKLDSFVNGWYRRIDLSILDINSETNSILGQLFGTFQNAYLEQEWLNSRNNRPVNQDDILYINGFYALSFSSILILSWKYEINKRLANDIDWST